MFRIINQNKRMQFIVLAVLAVIFFFVYSYLVFGNDLSRYTWPDETANYYFITNYIEHSNFQSFEELNEFTSNLIKPRSFNVNNYSLVPGSFLGMLLVYGLIGKIIGTVLIKFLTPFLAAIAGLFFYKILLKVFKPNIAFISTLLFFINPGWLYYASFSMLPNIVFITFILIGIYFLLLVDKDLLYSNLFVGLSGLFISLALIIRTNEALWVLGIIGLLFLVYIKKVKWTFPVIFIAICFLVFSLVLFYNNQTYGEYLSFGYLRLDQGDNLTEQLPSEFIVSGKSNVYSFVKFIVLPFGFDTHNFLSNIYNYFILLFWWIFIPAVLGIGAVLRNYQKKEKAVYLLICFCVSIYLIIYYGSWEFADKMTLLLNKIGISYVRYFLPIYILSLPLVSVCYITLVKLIKSKRNKILFSFLSIGTFIFFTINIVYIGGNDNLIETKKNINNYNLINQRVVELTESDSVIISERSDKIFFPQRKVISKWDFEQIEEWWVLLNKNIPLYYYAYEDEYYIQDLNDSVLMEYDIEFTDRLMINNKESLYKIKYIDYE